MLEDMRAILVVPTYGPVDPGCAKSVRVAMMHAGNASEVRWVGDYSPDRMIRPVARNTVAQELYREPGFADGIVWIDSDMMVPANAVTRLLGTAFEGDHDIVSGLAFQREPVHNPCFYGLNAGRYCPAEEYPPNALVQADACGFGFVWTSTRAIVKIAESAAFNPVAGWFPDRQSVGGFCEDIEFCRQATAAGLKIVVSTGIQIGHLSGPAVIGEEDFVRERRRYLDEKPETVSLEWGAK